MYLIPGTIRAPPPLCKGDGGDRVLRVIAQTVKCISSSHSFSFVTNVSRPRQSALRTHRQRGWQGTTQRLSFLRRRTRAEPSHDVSVSKYCRRSPPANPPEIYGFLSFAHHRKLAKCRATFQANAS